MSEVGADGVADDGRLGFDPTDAMSETKALQTQERAQGQPDVVALRFGRPRAAPLHLGALLDLSVIVLDREAPLLVLLAGHLAHRQLARGPVPNVAVWGDYLEYLDQPVADQPDHRPARRDFRPAQGPLPLAVLVHQAVGLQPGQPRPAQLAQQLQVVQAGVPAVEGHQARAEAALVGRPDHGLEVVVLGEALRLVEDAVVTGDVPVAVGPQQGDQVDALDDPVVLARPVAADQLDELSVGLVQHAIIDDQDASGQIDLSPGLLPEGFRVGLEAVQQPGEGVVGGGLGATRLDAGGFRGAGRLGRGDQEVDVVFRLHAGRVHASKATNLSPRAQAQTPSTA